MIPLPIPFYHGPFGGSGGSRIDTSVSCSGSSEWEIYSRFAHSNTPLFCSPSPLGCPDYEVRQVRLAAVPAQDGLLPGQRAQGWSGTGMVAVPASGNSALSSLLGRRSSQAPALRSLAPSGPRLATRTAQTWRLTRSSGNKAKLI